MRIPLYQLDAFADGPFTGNPAAVCVLEEWLSEAVMQNIAMENNLSETAFVVPTDRHYGLRWFTPTTEVNLCGHATLASGYVVLNDIAPNASAVRFKTRSGSLSVRRKGDLLEMDFPAWPVQRSDPGNLQFAALQTALGRPAVETYAAGEDWLAVYRSAEEVLALEPDFEQLKALPCRGIIVTCEGDIPGREEADFMSRFFAPACGVNEDPVTGSAHCALTPYWSERLGKDELLARQASRRGGLVECRAKGERVGLGGRVNAYLSGHIEI